MAEPNNVKSIFLAASEKPAAERGAFLEQAVAGDTILLARIEALLKAHDNPDSFLKEPAAEFGATIDLSPKQPSLAERPGTLIGPYKLLQQIGEGGMGVVFMAEQTEPIQRTVALKIIKAGMDTRQVIARFEAERQALALMDHSNIARVLDAGATESGRPYFVMELVRGVPITEYCDQNNLPVHERLELFVQVCSAVQHAHQKGIIHRDLKPSNVLVTLNDGRAVPKVIDFGVAKATGQQLTEETLFTAFAQMVGTPLYMSPEQAEMTSLDIDTRSDIYSLGVLLYELLTGTTPFDQQRMRAAAFDEIRRIIREEEPPKPSTRISTLGESRTATAAHRKVDSHRLGRLMEGDLDWIVMKALEKDRTRRYDTAGNFAADVLRHLSHLPVEACPPSVVYRFRKFARRNRGLLMTAGLVVAALVVGTVVSVSQAVRATKARAVAEANADMARQAVDDMYTQVAEKWLAQQPQMEPIQREFLEKALHFYTNFAKERSTDPAVRLETARAYRRVAEIQEKLGKPTDAERAFNEALATLEKLVDEFPDETKHRQDVAQTLHNLGSLLGDTGRYSDELRAHRRAVALQEKLLADFPGVTKYRRDLGRGYSSLAANVPSNLLTLKEKEQAYHSALAIQKRLVAEFPNESEYRGDLAETYLSLANILDNLGREEEHVQTLRESAVILEGLVAEFPTSPAYRNELADVYYWLALSPLLRNEAEKNLRQALAIQEKMVAEFPSVTVYRYVLFRSQQILANLLSGSNRLSEAEDTYRSALAIGEKLAADAPTVHYYRGRLAYAYSGLARLLTSTGRLQEAEAVYRQLIALQEKLAAEFPDSYELPADLINSYNGLAGLLIKTGRLQEAVPLVARGVEVDPTREGKDDKLAVQIQLGDLMREAGEFDQAMARYSEVIATKSDMAEAWGGRGQCYLAKGELTKAAEEYTRAIKLKPAESWYWHERGYCYLMLGQHEKSIADHTKAIELGDTDAGQRLRRGRSYQALGELENAEKDYSRAIELNSDYWENWHARGQLYAQQSLRDKAEADLVRAMKLKAGFANDPWLERSQVHVELREWKEAIDELEKAVSLTKEDDKPQRKKIAVAYKELCYAAFQQQKHDITESAARKAIELQPDYGEAYLWLGIGLSNLGNQEDAITAYHKAIELQPDHFGNYRSLSLALWRHGKLDEANSAIRKAIELQPDDGSLYARLGGILIDQGKVDEGLAAIDKAIELNPQDAASINQIAWFLATTPKPQHRDPRRAVELAKKAVELAPQDGAIWNTLGIAQYRAGDWQAAVDGLQKAMDLRNGGDSSEWFFLAMAHWQLGHKDEARTWYDKAIEGMDKNQPKNGELLRFRAEADELLGISEPATSTDATPQP